PARGRGSRRRAAAAGARASRAQLAPRTRVRARALDGTFDPRTSGARGWLRAQLLFAFVQAARARHLRALRARSADRARPTNVGGDFAQRRARGAAVRLQFEPLLSSRVQEGGGRDTARMPQPPATRARGRSLAGKPPAAEKTAAKTRL